MVGAFVAEPIRKCQERDIHHLIVVGDGALQALAFEIPIHLLDLEFGFAAVEHVRDQHL